MENNTRNTFPTPVSLHHAITGEGKEYVAATMPLSIIKIEEVTTDNGKKVVRARACINKRTKIIANYLGIELPEEDELWISVRFWENQAETFMKFATDKETGEVRTSVRVTVAGTLTSREYEKQDGTKGMDITLTGNMFWR